MRYAYPCDLVSYEHQGDGFLVTFPDVPPAITGAYTREESLFLAEDALIAGLSFYLDDDEDLPVPSALSTGQVLITVPPLQSAKLALYSAMRERGASKTDLAREIGASESAISDLLDLDWDSDMAQVNSALDAMKSLDRVPA